MMFLWDPEYWILVIFFFIWLCVLFLMFWDIFYFVWFFWCHIYGWGFVWFVSPDCGTFPRSSSVARCSNPAPPAFVKYHRIAAPNIASLWGLESHRVPGNVPTALSSTWAPGGVRVCGVVHAHPILLHPWGGGHGAGGGAGSEHRHGDASRAGYPWNGYRTRGGMVVASA